MSRTCVVFVDAVLLTPNSTVLVEEGVAHSVLIKNLNNNWQHLSDFQKTLPPNTKTIILLPAQVAGLHQVSLPKLTSAKKRAAIPFFLEENLVDSVNELHFAFDDTTWPEGVIVVNKNLLLSLMKTLEHNSIDYDAVTLDWFALNQDEMVQKESIYYIRIPFFQGTVHEELLQELMQKLAQQVSSDHNSSEEVLPEISNKSIISKSYEWFAERITTNSYVNLCQAELQHGSQRAKIEKNYRLAGYILFALLISALIFPLLNFIILNKQVKKLDQQVTVEYKRFFPQAKQVTSPEFRMRQWLKTHGDVELSDFWVLMQYLAQVYNPKTIQIKKIDYSQQRLYLNVTCASFDDLEKIQKQLEKFSVKLARTKAENRNNQVEAILELRV